MGVMGEKHKRGIVGQSVHRFLSSASLSPCPSPARQTSFSCNIHALFLAPPASACSQAPRAGGAPGHTAVTAREPHITPPHPLGLGGACGRTVDGTAATASTATFAQYMTCSYITLPAIHSTTFCVMTAVFVYGREFDAQAACRFALKPAAGSVVDKGLPVCTATPSPCAAAGCGCPVPLCAQLLVAFLGTNLFLPAPTGSAPLLADGRCPVPLRSQARRPALSGTIRRGLAAGAAHLLCTGTDGGHGRGVARCFAIRTGVP